jgi:hypothetical protein
VGGEITGSAKDCRNSNVAPKQRSAPHLSPLGQSKGRRAHIDEIKCWRSPRGVPMKWSSKVLVPFNRHEAISVKRAADIAGRPDRTIRCWCNEHGIGIQHVDRGGWSVSRVALTMFLDRDSKALEAYRHHGPDHECVRPYFERLGIAI